MSKREFAKAKRLIESKRYHDAIETLAHIDHSKAAQWIYRVEKLQDAQERRNRRNGCLIAVIAFFACFLLIAGWNWSIERQQAQHVRAACDLAALWEYQCDSDRILERYPASVDYCENNIHVADEHFIRAFMFCLVSEGAIQEGG